MVGHSAKRASRIGSVSVATKLVCKICQPTAYVRRQPRGSLSAARGTSADGLVRMADNQAGGGLRGRLNASGWRAPQWISPEQTEFKSFPLSICKAVRWERKGKKLNEINPNFLRWCPGED